MKKVILALVFLIVLIFLYGKYIEVNYFNINSYTINATVPESFKNLKIVQFSDILYDGNTKTIDKVIDKINNEDADILIFTGDLFKKGISYKDDDYDYLKTSLKKLKSSLYKLAVIGDNDSEYLNNYKDILYEAEFQLLDNENKLLFYEDETPINVIGLTDLSNIDNLIDTANTNYNLVITHKPDYADDLTSKNINTIICGHSLGGVIKIPYYGGIIKKNGSKKYVNDYYKLNDMEVFISNGIGYDNMNFRLFNAPSISVYKFAK